MDEDFIKYGIIQRKIVSAILDTSTSFTVDEIATNRGLLYKSVKRVVDKLLNSGFIKINSAKTNEKNLSGKPQRGRPKIAYELVKDHKKIRQLSRLISKDHTLTSNSHDLDEPSGYYYEKAKREIDDLIQSKLIEDVKVESIWADLKIAKKEESTAPSKFTPLKLAFIDFQKGRLQYARGKFKTALSKFISSAKVFNEYDVYSYHIKSLKNILKCVSSSINEEEEKIIACQHYKELLPSSLEKTEIEPKNITPNSIVSDNIRVVAPPTELLEYEKTVSLVTHCSFAIGLNNQNKEFSKFFSKITSIKDAVGILFDDMKFSE